MRGRHVPIACQQITKEGRIPCRAINWRHHHALWGSIQEALNSPDADLKRFCSTGIGLGIHHNMSRGKKAVDGRQRVIVGDHDRKATRLDQTVVDPNDEFGPVHFDKGLGTSKAATKTGGKENGWHQIVVHVSIKQSLVLGFCGS